MREAVPGSFAAKAGVFGRALGGALTQKVFGVDPSQYQGLGKSVTPADRQMQAQQMSAPLVKQLAAQTQASFNQEMLALQAREPVPGTPGAFGVLNANDLPSGKRQEVVTRMVDGLIKTLTNNRIQTLQQAEDLADRIGQTDPAAQALTMKNKQTVQNISRQLVANPDRAASSPEVFANFVSGLYYIASQAIFKGDQAATDVAPGADKITVDPKTNQYFINGEKVNYSNSQHIAALKAQGITVK